MVTKRKKAARRPDEQSEGVQVDEDAIADAFPRRSLSETCLRPVKAIRNAVTRGRLLRRDSISDDAGKSPRIDVWLWIAFAFFLFGTLVAAWCTIPSVEEARIQVLSNVKNVRIWETMNGTFWVGMDQLNSVLSELAAQLPAFNLSAVLPAYNATMQVGAMMAQQGYKAKYPVIIVPGFVTSGLELWEGTPCGKKYFRQRMWGTLTMMQTFVRDTQCWLEHMSLNATTGLDPEGVKLRAALGLEAVDYFIQGYWVWGKLIQALAEVGYDNTNLISMSYDWRIGLPLLEQRDGYFTRLRSTIEVTHQVTGLKVAVLSHSMGDNVFRTFLHWMEEVEPGWVEQHVEAWGNIGGLMLGVPSSLSCLLSGELMATAHLEGLAAYLTNSIVPRQERVKLWRTWGSALSMLPHGGPAIWGNTTWAPDDDDQIRRVGRTYGAMVAAVATEEWRLLASGVELNSSEVGSREEWAGLTQTLRNWFTTASGSKTSNTPNFDAAQYLDVHAALHMLGHSWGPDFWRHITAWSALRLPPDVDPPAAESGPLPTDAPGGSGLSPGPNGTTGANASCGTDGAGTEAGAEAAGMCFGTGDAAGGGGAEGGAAGSCSGSGEGGAAAAGCSGTGRAAEGDSAEGGSAGNCSSSGDGGASGAGCVSAGGGGLPEALLAGLAGVSAAAPATGTAGGGDVPEAVLVGPAGVGTAPKAAEAAPPRIPAPGTKEACAAANQAGSAACEAANGVQVRDPLTTPLPAAPSLRIVCLYGVGKPTERGYHYLGLEPGLWDSKETADVSQFRVNTAVSDLESGLEKGVQLADGDGTVPIISLGLMCRKGWRQPHLNPAGLKVTTREYRHAPNSKDNRGGAASGDHVDILGNEAMMADVLRLVTGHGDELQDSIISRIDEIAAQVDFDTFKKT